MAKKGEKFSEKELEKRKSTTVKNLEEFIGESISDIQYNPEEDDKEVNELALSLQSEKFSTKEENYINFRLQGYNPNQAAIKAKYSPYRVMDISKNLEKHPKIIKEIEIRRQQLRERYNVSHERVVEEMSKLAFSNIQDLYDAEGNLISVPDLPNYVAAAISSVEVVNKTGDDGNDFQVLKYKMYDKKSQLETLGKHLGIFEKNNTIMLQLGVQNLIKALPKDVQEQVILALMKRVEGSNLLEG